MPTPIKLKQRLEDIASSLSRTNRAYALLGLGSAGLEQTRLDEYSDLDFFVVAKEGHKQEFIQNLNWLTNIQSKGYSVQNTVDGHKFLFSDGIFCEFAIFEPDELQFIPFSRGQIVWAEPGFDCLCLEPKNLAGVYNRSDNVDWIMGESLTNLFVGLGRFCRGEKLSAMKFVQSFSLDRIVDLMHLQQPEAQGLVDQYMPDRRIESRLEGVEYPMSKFAQGYDRSPQSALAQLEWLEQHFTVNEVIATEIRRLANIGMSES